VQQHQCRSHTPSPHGRQARRCSIPDPHGPGNLAISDGQHVARSVPPCDIGSYFGCVRTPDVALRERPAFDDPLPGEPANVLLKIRGALT
jgi:hypothetical protein